MMENRKKIGLLIIIIAFIVLAIIIVLFMKKKEAGIIDTQAPIIPVSGTTLPSTDNVTPTTNPGDRPDTHQVYDISQETVHVLDANDASKLSVSFAERLGSFSNQSNFGNITDLKIFMTPKMIVWADKEVSNLRAANYSGEYYGITTKALTTKTISYDKKLGTAQVEVTTERIEGRADTLGASFTQKMMVTLIQKNDQWLVDSAYWEDK